MTSGVCVSARLPSLHYPPPFAAGARPIAHHGQRNAGRMSAKRPAIAIVAMNKNSKIGRPRYRRMANAYHLTSLRFGWDCIATL
jgi:hypothetical protein